MRSGTLRLFCQFALLPSTIVRALKVAAVVTPILTVLNHSQEIMALDFTLGFYLQMGLTFCVPYLVSTYSSAMTEVTIHREGLEKVALDNG